MGASSPQFFQALCTNELLKSVLFEFVKIGNETGEEYVYHTVKLVDAAVSEIAQYVGSDGPTLMSEALPELEKVWLTFQRIEIENKDGKTSAVDDWVQGK